MGAGRDDAIQRALEQLFRLNASRKVHARQSAAAGVVVSQPALALLRRIEEDGPLPIGELARLSEMDPAAAGRQVRGLEEDGLVRRQQSPEDGRVTVVGTTSLGRDVHRRIGEVRAAHMDDVLGAWTAADRERFGSLLARFVADLRTVRYRAVE